MVFSRVLSNTTVQKHQFFGIQPLVLSFLMIQLSHPYMTTGKTIALSRQTFVGKVMSLLFNMLSLHKLVFKVQLRCVIVVCKLWHVTSSFVRLN